MKITDPEYVNWQQMSNLPRNPNYWIYFSPDNMHTALVNAINNEIKAGRVDRLTMAPGKG